MARRKRIFSIGDAASKYAIKIGGFTGNVTVNALQVHAADINGAPFTTNDQDNDKWANANCAAMYLTDGGGWWYNQACSLVSPTARYGTKRHSRVPYVRWKGAFGQESVALKYIAMKIRYAE